MARILMVDDEAKIREVVKEYANFEGIEVVEAADGMEAVEKVRDDQNFDCVVMDVMMPKLDGYSACKEIKKIKNIPVIMLSARGEEYDKLFGFEVGIDDYVVKPFSPKELMARIKVVIKRSSREPREDVIKKFSRVFCRAVYVGRYKKFHINSPIFRITPFSAFEAISLGMSFFNPE